VNKSKNYINQIILLSSVFIGTWLIVNDGQKFASIQPLRHRDTR